VKLNPFPFLFAKPIHCPFIGQMQAINGESRPQEIMRCRGCFFRPGAARILYALSFRMNSVHPAVESEILRLTHFDLAHKALSLMYLRASPERE
jgi:hypothetical protein